jgi:CxxC-x17-CxxC domain-containing protein
MEEKNEEREMFDVKCAECGTDTQVPFNPTGDRPVYCLDCFKKQRSSRGGGDRQMFDAVCADCGGEAKVPFNPTGDRPVYCRDCFAKHRG